MSAVQIAMPPKLIPVFAGEADVRGAYGGRGSGKTRSFAKMTATRGLMWAQQDARGLILCGREWQNSLAESSFAEVAMAIREEPFLRDAYDIGKEYIRTRCQRIEYAFAGLNRNIDSVKSKARIRLCWVDEGEGVTENSWMTLIPTLREEDSELWVTWNPKLEHSATDKRFRRAAPNPRRKIVEVNWRDNPRFPTVLERTRQEDYRERPETYDHVWEGDYLRVVPGSYYATYLTAAKAEGRVGRVSADPLMAIRLFMDLGGTGAKADAFAIWAAQFVGREIRVLDYYEAQGQPIGAHLDWMRQRGYTPERCSLWLPHDGVTNDRVVDVSFESAFQDAGYATTVVENMGPGAARQRIEAARRVFPMCWFNDEPTAAGRTALGFYHEKRDESRNLGLGPAHDWSSHGADAFGLMAVCYEAPPSRAPKKERRSNWRTA